ncbi:MAG: hypothetical protein AAGI23_10115 [Bacteroidota bacterium]
MNLEQFTWSDLLVEAVIFIGSYFVLRFLKRRLSQPSITSPLAVRTRRWVEVILLIYEPLVVLIIGSTFVLINPLLHGVIIGGLAVIAFPYLRHYLSGLLLQINQQISLGKRLKTDQQQGVITRIGRLGLYLQTTDGRSFTNYTDIYKKGYTLTDQEVGGFYALQIKSPVERKADAAFLDLLASLPYLDWNHRPKIRTSTTNNQELHVQLSVKEEKHLHELIRSLEEREYECEVLT